MIEGMVRGVAAGVAGAAASCVLLAATAEAGPIMPVYFATFQDAVTGDGPNPQTSTDGKLRWVIDPGADSYQNDVYERPTTQEFKNYTKTGGGTIFAAKEYYENLDIVRALAGFDDTYLYIAIDLFGLSKRTEDGKSTTEGLLYEYGFRVALAADGANGFLLTSDQPLSKHGTTFGLIGNSGYQDTNGDVGGLGTTNGLSITKQDVPSQVNGNGYNSDVIKDGKKVAGGQEALWARVNPLDNTTVEFAWKYGLFGLTQANLLSLPYLEFQSIKGGPKDPKNYLWNDEYNKSEAGSPYPCTPGPCGGKSEFNTQGLGNIYELDTVRGGPIGVPVPEPAGLGLLGLAMLGILVMLRGRRGTSPHEGWA